MAEKQELEHEGFALVVLFGGIDPSVALELSEQCPSILLAYSSLDAISKHSCGLQAHVL